MNLRDCFKFAAMWYCARKIVTNKTFAKAYLCRGPYIVVDVFTIMCLIWVRRNAHFQITMAFDKGIPFSGIYFMNS